MIGRCIPNGATLPGQRDEDQPAPVETLLPGRRFSHHGLIYTVEKTDLGANRYDLTCTFNRRAIAGNFRWTIDYVAHLLMTKRATIDPTDRCDRCGEPDSGEMAEVVVRGRSMIVHVECALAIATSRGVPVEAILA